MFASPRIRGLIAPALAVVALALALPGCSEDTKPSITKFKATPQCDVMKTVTKVNLDPVDSSIVSIDTLGVWMEVKFFARAGSGNELSDPTGANSPLEWRWTFGDGGTATNDVGPIHRYTKAGEYTVTLSVKDDDGDEDTASLAILVGEAFSDLDILRIEVEPDPALTFTAVPGSVATDLSQTWGKQSLLSGMDMVFDGELRSSCAVSGLVQQYLWNWTIVDAALADTTRIVDVDPVTLEFPPSFMRLSAELSVTEAITGVNRVALTSSLNPVGARVSSTADRTTVPNTIDTLKLVGYLLKDVQTYSLELEWADSAATLESLDFTPAIEAGFTATSTDLGAGRVGITLTNASGYPGSEIAITIADLDFRTKPVVPGTYPVRIRVPAAARTGDPQGGAPFTGQDGAIRLDSDCDADGVPDSFQAEFFPDLFDCNGNGIHDTCDIQSGESQDENGNGIPDECEES